MTETAGARLLAWSRTELWRFDLALAVATLAMSSLLIAGASERFDTGWPEVAAGVGAFALLLARRRWPLTLLLIAMLSTAVHIVVWERPTPMIFATVVLLATACVRRERWAAIALGVVVASGLYVLGLVGNEAEFGDARAVIGIAWAATAVGVADAVRSWRRYRESTEAQLRATVVAAEAQTRQQLSDERLAIARELHDLLAHNLSVMNVQTGAAQHLLRSDPDRAEESLAAARAAGRGILDELRELLSVLRHDDVDETGGARGAVTSSLPTIDELSALVETMRSSGLHVTWNRSGEVRALPPAASLAAFRIVQEALTNAAKHGTGSATLTTDWSERHLDIDVVNPAAPNGEVEPRPTGHGLIGMRERATANAGELTALVDGEVFRVHARIPVTGARNGEGGAR